MRTGTVALLAALAAATPVAAKGPVVRVEQGEVEGIAPRRGEAVRRFLGIPYAAPPIGPLRWRAPQPAAAWTGVREAQRFGARCMQPKLWDDMIFRSSAMDEDCLTLNVWTPAGAAPGSRLPVLVYVYGGGFIGGGSSEPRYDGASMAARGIVVVTMNYRLGAFGFLTHPQLTAENGGRASGNYGLLDQAAALAWVHRNVAAFGGDPRRITIGGESAGSMSVSGLMASPLTKPLIAGAIAESGALMPPVAPATRAEGEARGVAFAVQAVVHDLAGLRALSARRILDLQGKTPMRFGPVIDGHFLVEAPAATFAAGRQARVPLLIGSNSEEMGHAALLEGQPATVANYRAALSRLYGERADLVARLYQVAADRDVPTTATALASDRFLGFATWKMFDLHRRTGAPTFYYYYSRVRPRALSDPKDAPTPIGALHSAEIEYALGNLDANPRYDWTEEDRTVSRTMQGYFANFVKARDPNGAGLPRWPQAGTNDAAIMRQRIDVETASAPFAEQQRYVALEPLIGSR